MTHYWFCKTCKWQVPICENESMPVETCPQCGSENVVRLIPIKDSFSIRMKMQGKSCQKIKSGKRKREAHEFWGGDDFSVDREKFVNQSRYIDREHDLYFEERGYPF